MNDIQMKALVIRKEGDVRTVNMIVELLADLIARDQITSETTLGDEDILIKGQIKGYRQISGLIKKA